MTSLEKAKAIEQHFQDVGLVTKLTRANAIQQEIFGYDYSVQGARITDGVKHGVIIRVNSETDVDSMAAQRARAITTGAVRQKIAPPQKPQYGKCYVRPHEKESGQPPTH